MLLLIGQNTWADFESTGSLVSDKSITESSTICGFDKSQYSSKQTIEYNVFRAAFYLCPGDFAWNRTIEVLGNNSAMDNAIGLRKITENYGSSAIVEGAQVITWIIDWFLIFVAIVATGGAAVSVYGFFHAKMNPDNEDAQKHAHAPLALLWAIGTFTLPLTIIKLILLFIYLVLNYIGIQILFFTLDKANNDSDGISSSESRTINNYSSTYLGLGSDTRNTRTAAFAKGYSGLMGGGAAYFGVTNYNGEEFIEDIYKYSGYDVDFTTDDSYAVGIDVTSDIKNILHSNIPVLGYNFYRKSPLLDKNKEILGFKSYLGTIVVNANGTDIEDKSGDSLNNDTFMSEVSESRSLGDADYSLESDVKKLADVIYVELEAGNQIDTVNFQSNKFLKEINQQMQDSFAEKSEAAISQTFKPDEIKFKLNTTEPYAKMILRGSYQAGRMGHDRTGDRQLAIIDMFAREIDLNAARAECTRHYSEKLDQKKFVDAFNANKASGTIAKNAKANNDLLLPGQIDCIDVNYTLNRLDFLGSADEKDAGHYNNKQLAFKIGYDVAIQNYIIGNKKAANKDKVAYNGLIADLLDMAKFGFMGTLGLTTSRMSAFISAEANRNAVLINVMVPTYANATSYETNHVSLDALYPKITDDNRDALQESSFNQIPPQNFVGLNLTGFMKMTPARLTDSSIINSQAFNNAFVWAITPRLTSIYNMFGMDPELSMRDAGKACITDPDTCNARVKTPLLQGLILTGMNMIDYGMGMLIFKGVTGVGVLGFDSMDSVIDKIQAASIGNSGVANTVGSLGKLFVGLVGKIAEVAVRVADIILGMLVPLFIFYIIAGIFIGFVLPLITMLVIFGVVEILIMKAIMLVISMPLRSTKALLYNKKDWETEVKGQITELAALIGWAIFVVIFIVINQFLANHLDLSVPAWYILGNAENSITGSIVSIFAVLVLCVACVWKLLTSPRSYADETTQQVFGINIAEKDDLIQRLTTNLNHQRAIEALQIGAQSIANIDRVADSALRNSKALRNKNQEARKSQSATGE